MKFEKDKVYQDGPSGVVFPEIIYKYNKENETMFSLTFLTYFPDSKDLEIQDGTVWNNDDIISSSIQEIEYKNQLDILKAIFECKRILWE